MKKVFAISLLTIHLFNIVGYKLLFSFEENNAYKQMVTSINNNAYTKDELVQVKFALNTPYMQNNSSYERCDGEVEYKGVHYNYVKRMVQNDTLYLYCIPNQEKTNISNAKNLYAKQTADNPSGKTSEQTALKKVSFFNGYNPGTLSFNFDAHQSLLNQNIAFNNLTTLKGFTTNHLQPPDLFI